VLELFCLAFNYSKGTKKKKDEGNYFYCCLFSWYDNLRNKNSYNPFSNEKNMKRNEMFFVFSFCYQYTTPKNDPFLLNQTLTKILWRVFLCQFIMLSNKFFLIRQNNQHPFLILNYNQLARANVPHDPTYTKQKYPQTKDITYYYYP